MITTVRYIAAIVEETLSGEKLAHSCSTAKVDIIRDVDRVEIEFMESLRKRNPDKNYRFVPDYGELYSRRMERVN